MDVSGRCVLVQLRIRSLSGQKRDAEITRELCETKQARDKSVRANKSLFGDWIKPVQQAEGALRTYVNDLTLPWLDAAGTRILKSSTLEAFQNGLIGPEAAFDDAVRTFIANYDQVIDDARRTLGAAWRQADFPAESTLAKRFGVDVTYLPMPRSEDFRAALTADEMAMVKRNCEQALNRGVADAVLAAVNRIREPVAKMAERLRAYGKDAEGKTVGTFRDSLVENIREIIALAPQLNVTDDPRITHIHREMEIHLARHDAEALRVSPHLRDETAREAERILAKLEGAFA